MEISAEVKTFCQGKSVAEHHKVMLGIKISVALIAWSFADKALYCVSD